MKRLRDGEKEPSKERAVQTTIKIMVMGIFLCSTIIGTALQRGRSITVTTIIIFTGRVIILDPTQIPRVLPV